MRQSVRIHSGTGGGVLLQPEYDVVERVITYRPAYGDGLLPGLLYRVELPLPDESDGGFGFRSYDGAALEEGDVPIELSFRTRRAAPVSAEAPPPAPGCRDGLAAFRDGGCIDCHAAGATLPMGLELDSAAALRRTAISRVAHETDLGAESGRVLVAPQRFGLGMPVIDPGEPATSYLLYKLIIGGTAAGEGDAACTTTHQVPLPAGTCPLPDADERGRLADWFVKGDPMPPPPRALPGGLDSIRSIQAFVRAGAPTANCD